MWMRAARWVVAALIGSAMTTIGCSRERPEDRIVKPRVPVVADDSLVQAFDANIEMRLIDRIELDTFLRDRDIRVHVDDGHVSLTGQVWTPLEKERVTSLVRHVPGVIDVTNDLDIQPPE